MLRAPTVVAECRNMAAKDGCWTCSGSDSDTATGMWTAREPLPRRQRLEEANFIYGWGAHRALIWPRFRGQWRELTEPSARAWASVSGALRLTRLSVHEHFKHPFDFSLRAIFN